MSIPYLSLFDAPVFLIGLSMSQTPVLTRDGTYLGARLTLPFLPGILVFGAVFGTAAAQKGLSLLEALVMTGFVFAGASQFVAVELYSEPFVFATLLAMTGVTAAVNLRMILIGASLRPWFGALPAWRVYPSFLLLTDINWLIALKYRADGGNDWGVYLGSGLTLWIGWVLSCVPGYLLGALVSHPERWGLDLVMPAFFVTLLTPLWKGHGQTVAWLVAAVVACSVWLLTPGYWFVLAGAVAGAMAGAFLGDD